LPRWGPTMARKRSLFGDQQKRTVDQVGGLLEQDENQQDGVTEYINIGEISIDPKNSRKQGRISPEEIRQHNGGDIDLALTTDQDKKSYFDRIQDLANSIDTVGLLNAINVCSLPAEGYRIQSGERRFLAHLLLNRPTIRANIRPDFSRAAQAIENLQREDLNLYELQDLMQTLNEEFEQTNGHAMTAKDIQERTGKSLKTARRYEALISMPDDLSLAIESGLVTRLVDAVQLSKEPDIAKRKVAMELLANEGQAAVVQPAKKEKPTKPKRGRKRTSISLGSLKDAHTIQALFKKVYGKNYPAQCGSLDWTDFEDLQEAWKRALKYLEDAR